MSSQSPGPERQPHSQTLSRGIRVLEMLAESTEPLTIDELASRLNVHRSIAYRILRTLEDHRLVVRDGSGGVQLGSRMAYLARNVSSGLVANAIPELTSAASDLGMTCFLVVLDRDECITIASAEPKDALAIAQRPGSRHPLSAGAPGIAIQSVLTDDEWALLGTRLNERPETAEARTQGYASSHDEVMPGLSSVAVPLWRADQPPSAVAVVFASRGRDIHQIAVRLQSAAATISSRSL